MDLWIRWMRSILTSRESKKLEILKDSHIGDLFSVICLVLYELIYIGAYSEIDAVQQAGDRGSRTFSYHAVFPVLLR